MSHPKFGLWLGIFLFGMMYIASSRSLSLCPSAHFRRNSEWLQSAMLCARTYPWPAAMTITLDRIIAEWSCIIIIMHVQGKQPSLFALCFAWAQLCLCTIRCCLKKVEAFGNKEIIWAFLTPSRETITHMCTYILSVYLKQHPHTSPQHDDAWCDPGGQP